MNIPLPSGIGATTQQLVMIRRELNSLQPARTPGLLTSKLTGGITRRPKPFADDSGKKSGAARWA